MSIIFHQLVNSTGGVLPLSVGTGPVDPIVGSQGLAIDDTGAVLATTEVPPVRYAYGLPFDGDSRLVVGSGPIEYYDQGLPFNADGALVGESSDDGVGHYNQGIAYGPSGGLSMSGLAPPPPTGNRIAVFNMGSPSMAAYFRIDTSPWQEVQLNPASGTIGSNGVVWNAPKLDLCFSAANFNNGLNVLDTSTTPFTVKPVDPVALSTSPIAASPDGTRLAVGYGGGGTGIFLDTTNYTNLVEDLAAPAPRNISWSGDSQKVAFSTTSGMFIKDRDGNALPLPTEPPTGQVWSLVFHPTLDVLYACDSSGRLNAYDLTTGLFLNRVFLTQPSNDMAISNDGTRLVYSANTDLRVMVITDPMDVTAWTLLPAPASLPSGNSRGVRWESDGSLFAVAASGGDKTYAYQGNGDNTVYTQLPSFTPTDQTGSVNSVDFMNITDVLPV